MKTFYCILVGLFFSVVKLLASPQAKLIDMNNAELLIALDNVLTKQELYESQKKTRLNRLKDELRLATDDELRYWTARNLYNEYKNYDSDSALCYVNLSIDYAKKVGRKKWIDEMNIFRSYIYSATGLLEEAKKTIYKVNPDSLDRNMYFQYNEQLLFLYTHRDQYLGLNSKENPYTTKSMELLENLVQHLPETDPLYVWFRGWYSLSNEEKAKDAIVDILSIVNESKFESVNDAKNSWILSRLYEKIGDNENKLRFLILSAIADVKTHNKEIASLEEVANIMYRQNDLKRANEYISYCLKCANEYKSRIRVGRLADLQHKITAAYQHETEEQKKDIQIYFFALIIIVMLLLCILVFSFRQNRELRLNKVALNDANAKLSFQVDEQKNLQEQLREMNNKLDEFRRNIYRMLVAHRYDELKELTKNPELSNPEIEELYQNFDKIFLGIYPDFVKDFNTLLRPEEQIVLKKADKLNTELRIYALVRLGLDDSTKIAQFLHCSVRTVYNTCQRIRNKAIVSKDDFANIVKSLGKFSY